jgi:NTE family protein
MKPPSLGAKHREVLHSFELFKYLPDETFSELCANLALRREPKGSVIFHEGDNSTGMYLLIDGSLEIFRSSGNGEYRIAEIRAPNIIGELAYFTGSARNAGGRATKSILLAEISVPFLMLLADHDAIAVQRFFHEVSGRLIESNLHRMLQQSLGIVEASLIRRIADTVEIREVPKGAMVIDPDLPAEEMAILLDGRLIVRNGLQGAEPNQLIARIFPGETIGETGLLQRDHRRNAAVLAQRASRLAVIRLDVFESILIKHPEVLINLIRTIIDRQNAMKDVTASAKKHLQQNTIAILQDSDADLKPLLKSIDALDSTRLIDGPEIVRHFHSREMLQLSDASPLEALMDAWIHHEEILSGQLFLVADRSGPGWTRFAQNISDSRYVFSRYGSDKPLGKGRFRVIHHREGNSAGSASLPPIVDVQNTASVERTARLLTGRGIGLVLSGGGARGFAHIGVLRALEKAGIKLDSLGGTSMGALVAAAYAIYGDIDSVEEITARFSRRRKILDWTIPVSSLTSSHKVGRVLRAILGDWRFEDLEFPLFVVASDLAHFKEVVFTRGPLYDAVRASGSIPGIFYPVIREGMTLVDGGVLNNLPIDIMRRRIGGGSVIASDVGLINRHIPRSYRAGEKDGMSGLLQLLGRHFSRPGEPRPPALADLFMQTFEVNTGRRIQERGIRPDHNLSIDVSAYDPMDFNAYRSLIREGYEQASRQLEALTDGKTATAHCDPQV